MGCREWDGMPGMLDDFDNNYGVPIHELFIKTSQQ